MTTIVGAHGTVTTAGDGVGVDLTFTGLTEFDLTDGKFLRLTLLIDDLSRIDQLLLFIGGPSLIPNLKWRFNASTGASQIGKDGELFVVTLQLSELNAVGGGALLSDRGVPSVTGGFTEAQLTVIDDATGAVEVTLYRVEIVTPAVTGGFVSITFDDSWASTLSLGYPRMATFGFKGTAYTIVEALGQADRATEGDLKVLNNAGWEIAGHSHALATSNYTDLTAAQAASDLALLRDWLDSNHRDGLGRLRYNLAYPQGGYEDTTDGVSVETLAAAAGFRSGRTVLSGVGVNTHVQANALPPAMPYRLNAISGISETLGSTSHPAHPLGLIAVGGMLDKIAENGGWLILAFHMIVTGAPTASTEVSEEGFNSVIQGIAGRDLTVKTVRDVLSDANAIPPRVLPV